MRLSSFKRGTSLLAPALALCSWISLNPYFFWGTSRHMSLAGLAAGVIALLAVVAGDRPRKSDMVGFALMAIFIVYISFLPKTDGSLTKWYFVLPTMLALFVFSDERRADLTKKFSIIFALSVLPGIVVSLLSIAGVNIEFDHKPLLNPVMAAAGGYYLNVPGVLLLGNNVTALPWGGALYRLCGIYDEPGMIGTVSAFLLAANRFRIKSPVNIILFVGGLLSFSLAFAVLTVSGFAARLILNRSAKTLVPLALCVLAGLLSAGVIKPDAPPSPAEVVASEAVPSIAEATLPVEPAPALSPAHVETIVSPTSTLRQTQYLNNRSLPEMQQLTNNYWSSDLKTLLFGISSDASLVYGGVSQVITRIFTDFGIVGMVLFTGAMGLLALSVLRRADRPVWALLFFGLFFLSVYQRPIVWMPYAFTLFVCCPILASVSGHKRIESFELQAA